MSVRLFFGPLIAVVVEVQRRPCEMNQVTVAFLFLVHLMQKQYAYPTLSIEDIISNFASWGFSISQEQLMRPSPDFALSIYSICLSRVTDISQEALADAADAVISSIEHPVSSIFT
jgi:hypothetical protein